MFKIGEFSKIAQVSGRMLRHYDKIGLLTPSHTDPFTGYRYYTADQLPRLNRILALKDLGLSLQQIGRLLNDNISASEIRGMLTLRKAEIEQTLREEIGRLRTVEMRLNQIEQEGQIWEHDIIIKAIPTQPILSIRETGDSEHFQNLFISLQKALPMGQAPYEQIVFIMHSDTFEEEEMDLEIGYLLPDAAHAPYALMPNRHLTVRDLPGADTMATLIQTGMNTGSNSYNILGTWIEANGYQIVGPGRELFLEISWPHEGHNIMELQFPVEKTYPQPIYS